MSSTVLATVLGATAVAGYRLPARPSSIHFHLPSTIPDYHSRSHKSRTAARAACPRALFSTGEDNSDLLPHAPYPGVAPVLVGGEMELQEMEDDLECRTQLFFNMDGSVLFGATDGPPPLSATGSWQ